MTEEKKEGQSRYEEFRVSGGEILNKVKEIIHEGNVRRIILKDDQGKTFMEIPLTVGVVGAIIAPRSYVGNEKHFKTLRLWSYASHIF